MFNERLCSHPNCNVEATSLCRNHCCLSICENHRVQHESLFLADFENQLNQLETPIQRSIIQTKTLLEQLDRSFQQDLRRLKSTFDEQFRLVDCRIDFLQQRKDLFEKSREYAKRCQQTGQQPTKEDFSKLNDLLEKIQHDLQRQKEISRLIDDRNSQMESWMLTGYFLEKIFSLILILFSFRKRRRGAIQKLSNNRMCRNPGFRVKFYFLNVL